MRNPVKHFFSQRLKVFFEAAEVPLADEEPFVLDALQRYSLSDSLLNAALTRPDQLDQALSAQALRLQGSGLLPMVGFGECLRNELIEPLPDLLQRYQQLLALWPTPHTGAEPISFDYQGIQLDGWISGLHRRSDGGLLSVTTIPNSIGSIKTRKWHRLTRPWVIHLVACACGLSLSTGVGRQRRHPAAGPAGKRRCGPSCCSIDLLLAWQTGMQRPLPVAVKTAFAWLGPNRPRQGAGGRQQSLRRRWHYH
ncbi:hypothetical protein RHM66_14890 [Pseudomonas sp. RTB3]|nr:hypothetical protein RHM66_14890 [Pseudomonas sp. RTB3]